MSSLSDKFPKDTFKSLLKIGADELDGSLATVESGDGVATPLKISTTSVEIGGVTYPTSGAVNGRVLQVGSNGTSAAWVAPVAPSTDYDDLTNKPDFADVAFSGDYQDLINAPTDIAGGGQIQSGSVTLTASSPMVQKVTPTGFNQWVKLPDATTMSAGGVWYMIHNAGSQDIMVRDNSDTLLGFIRPNVTASVGLVNASTAAGDWVMTGTKEMGTQVSADIEFPSTLGSVGKICQVVVLDSTREMLFFRGTARVYAVIWNSATGEFGTPYNVRAGSFTGGADSIAIKSADNQVLAVTVDTNLIVHATTLTVSGMTINANSTASVTGSGASYGLLDLIAVEGQGFALAYNINGASVGVRAITVSGTTPSIGAQNVQSSTANSANNPPSMFDVGSGKILVFTWSTSGGYIRPLTMAGTTLTPGTEAVVSSVSESTYSVRLLQSGRWAVISKNPSGVFGVLVTLTGTVASVTAPVLLMSGGNVTMPVVWAKGNQVVVCGDLAGIPFTSNVLTDNNGTPVAGTMISREGNPYTAMIGYDSDSVYVLNTGGTAATGRYYRIGIQGNNAKILSATSIASLGYDLGGYPLVAGNGNTIINTIYGKNKIHPAVLQGTKVSYASNTGGGYALMWKCTGGMVDLEIRPPMRNWIDSPSNCRVGNSTYWISNNDGTNSVQVQRIQVA